jgi:DNA-binding LytR/AlgR family response regulator
LRELIKYVIVDDDPVFATILQKYAEQITDFKCNGCYESGLDFLNSGNHHVDLIFMDVEMPEINGLETIASLNSSPIIVLVSSFVEYAYDAFEHGVADYLLKPVSKVRFLKCINKVRIVHRQKNTSSLSESYKKSDDRIFIKHKDVFKKVNYSDIKFIQSRSEYVEIVAKEYTFMHYGALKNLATTLPPSFLRVHRSYIVNMDHVISFGLNSLEVDDQIIPVSKSYAEKVREKIDTLS